LDAGTGTFVLSGHGVDSGRSRMIMLYLIVGQAFLCKIIELKGAVAKELPTVFTLIFLNPPHDVRVVIALANIKGRVLPLFWGHMQGAGRVRAKTMFLHSFLLYAENLDVAVILIDGKKLANYMIENELGVSLKQNYKIFNVDTDYFIEE
jgi:hypothetical protein